MIDKVSPAARRVEQSLENVRRQEQRNRDLFQRNQQAFIGTTAIAATMALSLRAPIQDAIEFQSQLTQIGFKADATAEKLKAMGDEMRAQGLATGRGAANQARSVDVLTSKGLSNDQAMVAAEQIGYAAATYGVSEEDLANAVGALLLNGGIGFEQIGLALDIMTKSGKLGQVEIADMAREFPALSAAAASMGYSGLDGLMQYVSWLQVAREGTSSASEATTNLSDFMMKLQAPDVIENFADMGVNITDELERARANGADPLLHALGLINKLTEGGKGDLVSQLFGEKNSLMFLQQALPKIEKVLAWQEELTTAQGTIANDFEIWSKTPAGVIAEFQANVEELNLAIGDSLFPKLTEFITAVTPLVAGTANFVKANDKLVAAVVEITAALIGLRLLAAAGGMAGAFFGLGGKGGNPLSLLGFDADNGKKTPNAPDGKPGGGASLFSKLAGILGLYELAKFTNEQGVGEGMMDPNKTWDHNVVHFLDPALARIIYEGYNPVPAITNNLGLTGREGGIGGGYTGPTQGDIDALKGEIIKLDAEISEWPEQALEERRARLAEKLAQMEAELAASSGAVVSDFSAMLAQMRAAAAAGVTIPLHINGPRALPSPSRMIDAPALSPSSLRPPAMPSRAPQASAQPVVQHVTVGDVHVTQPTNANPRQLSRALGEEVGKVIRTAKSNSAYA
jgi:TP901 family phage tail tape measure protein